MESVSAVVVASALPVPVVIIATLMVASAVIFVTPPVIIPAVTMVVSSRSAVVRVCNDAAAQCGTGGDERNQESVFHDASFNWRMCSGWVLQTSRT